jgi:hypothetical protein
MSEVVLLGDSVFDNAAYVGGGPDVVTQLQQRLPDGWRASLLAVDGSVMASLPRQLSRLPGGASHLVVSVGGNDALGYSSILGSPSRSVADTLTKLADIQDRFRSEYAAAIDRILAIGLPTALCTIYDVRYPDPEQRRMAIMALGVINDCIIREAAGRGIPLLDLRLICGDDADFANPIEPSVKGGWKIAGAIASLLSRHDFGSGRCEVFAR